MRPKNHFPGGREGIAVLLLAASLANVQALAPATVVLPESTKPVAAAPSTGTVNPQQAFVSRLTLTSAESSAPMVFEVALKMKNFSELQARVSRGERISPKEMAEKYEPSATDYQAVADWLKGEGFTIVRQDSHHLAIFARGKVSQIAQALKVSFARVTSEGKEYTSAVTAPSVPATISPLLIGINGLQPHLRAHKHLIKQQAQPNASSGGASYIPSQIAQAYGATSLYNMNITGGGQTIAIVIDTFPSTTDLLLFWKNGKVNQSINNIQFVQAVAGTLPTDATSREEVSLDTEWSSSIAPGAHVRVYAATDLMSIDLDQAYQQVLDDATNHPEYGIHQMSMSYGEGETYTTQTQVDMDDDLFMELAVAGVTCFASSGDGGTTPGSNGAGDETGPLQVESPASDPYVTGVGGTSLTLDANNNESSEVVWSNSSGGTGGGTSIYFARPTWQTGAGVPTGTMREVPDVASSADPDFGAIYYLNGVQSVVGGTSWASPTWAGLCALMNQARANAGQAFLGTLGPHIYPLLGTANYSADIRDITSGNNATSRSGSTNGIPNYTAGTGYDMATGIGAPLTQALTQTLVGSSTLVGVQMPVAEQLLTQGQNATFTVAVGGSSATYQWQRMPAGSATWSNLSDNGTYSGSATVSLTVTDASPAMSGDQFQCVITLGGNVVTSTPSVLIVDTPLIISTLAGTAGTSGLQNGSGTGATFAYPSGIALDSSSNLYIADYNNNEIREVTSGGVVSTPYGSLTGASGSTNAGGNSALFNTPNGIAADSSNNLYVADTGNNLIRKIVLGVVSTLAGSVGSGGPFNIPEGVAVDGSGNVYVADTGNDTIDEISPAGAVSIIAGQTGTAGYADGAATTQALFNGPSGVAVDSSGNNIYVADFGNSVIRKISSGNVSTIAGQATVSGYLDGPGGSALFNTPSGVALDGSNNLYVADCLVPPLGANAAGNDLVRKINLTTNVVSTLAGQAGNEGAVSGTGAGAQFYSVQAVALNLTTGTVYLADTYNQTIRMGLPLPLPTISVAATQPEALVFGPTPGQFTVTRTGATTSSLTVNYSLAGTMANGTGYTLLPDTVTIPAGATSAAITVTPIEDSQAVSSPTVQLTLSAELAYIVGSPNMATVTIQELTPYQTWKMNEFGANATVASIAGDTATPENDGVPNLLKYLYDIDPATPMTAADRAALPTVGTTTNGATQYLTLTYRQYALESGLTINVQISPDLQTWTTVNPPDLSQQVGTDPITFDPIMEKGVNTHGATTEFIRLNVSMP